MLFRSSPSSTGTGAGSASRSMRESPSAAAKTPMPATGATSPRPSSRVPGLSTCSELALAALLSAACAQPARISLEIAPAPVALQRTHTGFWGAALALDFDRAESLAAREAQRQYLGAVRLVADGRLEEGQQALSRVEIGRASCRERV